MDETIKKIRWRNAKIIGIISMIRMIGYGYNNATFSLLVAMVIAGEIANIVYIKKETDGNAGTLKLMLYYSFPMFSMPYSLVKTTSNFCGVVYGSAIGAIIGIFIKIL